ncbi:kynureninase [Vannielia litorea]|uniref:kynureninase n=1 Tax=Vannielia litorea TaxID=1217970 RepID=UPI001C976620|nr:kynureninase [Vannielia litorea]MBY6048121.1 kynureninase [Vannielia litorea]MBY6075535.1 kynureninase [Vannielia litorea]
MDLISDARALDAADALAERRARYLIPGGVIYLDGNSLGPASHAALAALDVAAREEWAEGLIRSWNAAGWFEMPMALGDRIGRLIGARAGSVACCDTISVNLYKVLHACLTLRPDRRVILAEATSFPTDLYIAEGVCAAAGARLVLAEGPVEAALSGEVAAMLVNQVDYRTGAVRDMSALSVLAQEAGALAVWDLSHSAGALEVALDRDGADFAVGCTYKYLNGGPGAPGFVYAAERHHGQIRQPVSGWWGHARPFAFDPGYAAAEGVKAFLAGTQPVLSMRTLSGALDDWDGVDMAGVRAKSRAMTDAFVRWVEALCPGLELGSPREAEARGSQVSFRHPNGYEIIQALIARGVIGDFRAPDVLRFGFAPLYLSFEEVARAVLALRDVLESGEWREPRFAERGAVT